VQSATALYSSIIASFFYVSALNEALGYGNRIAKFLNKAAAIVSALGGSEALILKRRAKSDGRRSSRQRESSNQDLQSRQTCIAEFDHVTVRNPFNITLIQDLNMQVIHMACILHIFKHSSCSQYFRVPVHISTQIFGGQGCLISGPSGCGKSSLLRVMGKLWPAASGFVKIPEHVGPDGVFFLPQSARLAPNVRVPLLSFNFFCRTLHDQLFFA
jgi:ABC-type uncharacterized transport system fused permease/ATPase subunit